MFSGSSVLKESGASIRSSNLRGATLISNNNANHNNFYNVINAEKKKLTKKQKTYVILLSTLFILFYFIVTPSACLFFNYTSANEIALTIITAPPPPVESQTKRQLLLCPLIPHFKDPTIKINLSPSEDELDELTFENLREEEEEEGGGSVLSGGSWRPKHCISRHRVAIVVPYRNRKTQLDIFLYHMHRFLRRQLLDYRIFIVEQSGQHKFNRAALLNVGFIEALKLYDFHCFIFHDVDLLPERLENIYTCSKSPRHMTVAVNTMRYNLPYKEIFGGATAMTVEQFKSVNGYSNYFFGWGGEDDDISNRIHDEGMDIMRWDPKISRYYMMFHLKEVPSPNRIPLLRQGRQRYKDEGLSSLSYELLKLEQLKLYTRVLVQLNITIDL